MVGTIKKKHLFFFGVMLLLCFLLTRITSKNKLAIDQIMNHYDLLEQIDIKLLEKAEVKLINKTIKKADDYFILAYLNYLTDETESMDENLMLSLKYIDEKTHPLVKIYGYRYFANKLLEKGHDEQALEIVFKGFDSLEESNYHKYYLHIWELLKITIDTNKGRTLAIHVLETMQNAKIKQNKEMLYHNNLKLIPLYGMSMRYSDTIQACLSAIEWATKFDDSYVQNKLIVDLSITFRLLGQYQIAEQTLEEVLNIEIKDKTENAFIKIYALMNLAEIRLILNQPESVLDLMDEIEQYESFLNSEHANDYAIMRHLSISRVKIYEEEFESAKEHLLIAEDIIKTDKVAYIIDKDLYYILTAAMLYESQQVYESAINVFEKGLQIAESRDNVEEQKSALNGLLRIYKILDNKEKQIEMQERLNTILNREKEHISLDYILYTFQGFQNQKMIETTLRYRSVIVVIIGIVLCIGVAGIRKIHLLVSLSHKDHLTGAYNRRRFDRLYHHLMKKSKNNYSIVMLDIDNFKQLNDTYGHELGDLVLIKLCQTVKGNLGPKDYLFRYGGEEFAIIMQNRSKDEVYSLSEYLREKIEQIPIENDIKITVSIGIACSWESGDQTLKRADQNLYHSKTSGKNKITI